MHFPKKFKIRSARRAGLTLFAFSVLLLTVSCATDSKDIYFRSRLPTGENPHFKEQGKFGANLELESERLTTQATHNLVSDFTFKKRQNGTPFAQDYGELGLVG